MIAIGIDPGPTTSGAVVASAAAWPPRVVCTPGDVSADEVMALVDTWQPGLVACEWLTTYGAAVGASVLDTARLVGRVEQTALLAGADVGLMTRPDVCLELCQSRRAKKAQSRAALLDIYPATGGGKTPQVGTKKAPGPLYGISGHSWDALAVLVAWLRVHG